MKNNLHVIYVPGLGDDNPKGQARAVSTWRWWGVEAELFQMKWSDQEPWQPKFNRLLARIDELLAQNMQVGLVGASAGGSAVINAYAARKNDIAGVVCIAGKINRPELIGDSYRKKNPAFVTSVEDCISALKGLNRYDRAKILSRYAYKDEIIGKPDSMIIGAKNQTIPIVGHVPIIATQIFFGAPSFLKFLKRQAK